MYRLAIEKNFKLAVAHRHAGTALLGLLRYVSTLSSWPSLIPCQHHHCPDLAEWVHEVRQLEAEFGEVEVRWSDAVIRVVDRHDCP